MEWNRWRFKRAFGIPVPRCPVIFGELFCVAKEGFSHSINDISILFRARYEVGGKSKG